MKTWVLKGDTLEVEDGGARLPATADQVFSSVLEGSPAWPDLPAGKCGDAAGLSFSRYPIELFLVLSAEENGALPVVKIEGKSHDGHNFPVSANGAALGHVVREGTWFPVAQGSLEAISELLRESRCETQTGRVATLRGVLHLKKAANAGGPVIDNLPDSTIKAMTFGSPVSEGPVGVNAKLYPYQLDGWRWLSFIMREELGGLLADEMGLGKTLQVISALRDPGEDRRACRALVVAPGSLLENWLREINKFCPDFRVLKHNGPLRTGRPGDLLNYDVVIVSYDTVIRDLSLMCMIEWNAVILDEAQNIRNPDALRTKSVKKLPRDIGIAVTGTPVENRLRDLWSVMDFVVPGYLGDLPDFEAQYADEIEAASLLEPVVSPLILRRRVAEVAKDLPERIDIPEFLELSDGEASSYEELRNSISEEYGAAATLVSLGKLRQFCADPAILDGNYAVTGEFSKFDRLRTLLDEVFARGEKALVFTSFTRMADRIASMAERELSAFSATLDGRLPIDDRQPLIDRFSNHAGAAVLVLNPRAGGAGLNITAANHVIHYNPEWNPALEDQASARAYRRGQDLPVTIRRLIFAGTVEEVMDARLNRKRGIAEAAIVGVEGGKEDYGDIIAALNRSPVKKESFNK